jgi:hypothetical protein
VKKEGKENQDHLLSIQLLQQLKDFKTAIKTFKHENRGYKGLSGGSVEFAKLIGRQYYIAKRPGDSLKVILHTAPIIKKGCIPYSLKIELTQSVTFINQIVFAQSQFSSKQINN